MANYVTAVINKFILTMILSDLDTEINDIFSFLYIFTERGQWKSYLYDKISNALCLTH